MIYRDDDGSRTMQRRSQRRIEDDARAQTTTDRGRCGGTDEDDAEAQTTTDDDIEIIIRPKSVSPSVYSLSTPTPRLFHFTFSPPPPSSDAIDPAPLLLSGDENEGSNSNGGGEQQRSSSVRRPGLREAARLLSRASSGGGRAMREPSMVVREAAAEQLEERQSDWAYSKPIVVLDIVWNLAFVSVAGVILVMARNEHPIMPLRVWLLGYALQCVLHMVCVLVEYRRRNRVRNNRTPRSRSSSSSSSTDEDALGSRRNSHEETTILIFGGSS
ncbi:E3 ubiquitin-protein ligase At1g12760-like [Brassica napus]|uniref:E3 ubiquitin-protein ligase At1g12760-like n=1 Tax=Brassica napus TaxID=3708 RepID=UPI0006AAD26A|nr:E3 ubiquitin-protein ligase At1g12760-like [Brassica napus]